mmetsp:Transcript_124985/g.216614  ORF Transcript_124985/g.216614 Transcript_124985/m.216614 type:complete len:178 (+) Transcript_124985:88-621(+)
MPTSCRDGQVEFQVQLMTGKCASVCAGAASTLSEVQSSISAALAVPASAEVSLLHGDELLCNKSLAGAVAGQTITVVASTLSWCSGRCFRLRDERPYGIPCSIYKTRLKLNTDGTFEFRHEEDDASFTEASGGWRCDYEGEEIVVKLSGHLENLTSDCPASFERTLSRDDLLNNWEQ